MSRRLIYAPEARDELFGCAWLVDPARFEPDTGRNETAGDVIVLRVYGPGQDRRRL